MIIALGATFEGSKISKVALAQQVPAITGGYIYEAMTLLTAVAESAAVTRIKTEPATVQRVHTREALSLNPLLSPRRSLCEEEHL